MELHVATASPRAPIATDTLVQHGRRTNADSGSGAPKLRAPGARVAASRRQRPALRWRNHTTTAAPLGATADAAKSARAPGADSAVGVSSAPPGSNATARTLRWA